MKAAARAWASGRGGIKHKADDAMTQAAVYPEWMEQRLSSESDAIELAPDEASAFGLFVSLETQWNRHPLSGVRTGINYAAIRPTADMLKIDATPALLFDIRTMEGAALQEFARAVRR